MPSLRQPCRVEQSVKKRVEAAPRILIAMEQREILDGSGMSFTCTYGNICAICSPGPNRAFTEIRFLT